MSSCVRICKGHAEARRRIRRAGGDARGGLDPQELEFGEGGRGPATVRAAAERRGAYVRRLEALHYVRQQYRHQRRCPSDGRGRTGRVRVTDMARAAAVARIAFSRHRGHGIRVRGRRHPAVPGVKGRRNRPQTVHAEQAEQQGAHEQHAEPQRRLRSGELCRACHAPIVGMGRRPLASGTSLEYTRTGDTHLGY